jgi:hypothetical protein
VKKVQKAVQHVPIPNHKGTNAKMINGYINLSPTLISMQLLFQTGAMNCIVVCSYRVAKPPNKVKYRISLFQGV